MHALGLCSAMLHWMHSILFCCTAALLEHEATLQCMESFHDLEYCVDLSTGSVRLRCMHALTCTVAAEFSACDAISYQACMLLLPCGANSQLH